MTRHLIEEELPLETVNAASAREKSLRHGHISTLHLWWARRPLAMSRAVVFGTLMPDPADPAVRAELLKTIGVASEFEQSSNPAAIDPLRKALRDAYPERPPKVLDCFAGGGAIPLEALRLGCDTTAVDLNPVAHLIQRCCLDYPERFGSPGNLGERTLAEDFVTWAAWVRERSAPALNRVFPADARRRRPAVYFWARTTTCTNPACLAEIPLVSSLRLADSSRRRAWIALKVNRDGHRPVVDITVRTDNPPPSLDLDQGTTKAGSISCPACHTSLAGPKVREHAKRQPFGYRLYAVLDIDGRTRTYRSPTHDEVRGIEEASRLLNTLDDLDDGTTAIPDEPVDPIGYNNLQNLPYGYDTWRSCFTDRQLWVLASLCEAVRAAYAEMIHEGMAPDRARAVTTYLGLCVDRIVDRNSAFCTWDVGMELVRNTFPQQTIRMAWDITEVDPFGDGPGSWAGAVKWIQLVIKHCSEVGRTPATVLRGNAQRLPFGDGEFDAVIVDPPYYFSVMYSDLSDFFYVWLKRSVGFLYPELFVTQWTPKDEEVVQNRCAPSNPRYISAEEFELRMRRSLDEIARVVKPDGIVSLVFAHTDVVAWEKLLHALRSAGLVVTTSWPMRSEMGNRPLAQVKAALGSSIVLVCRRAEARSEGYYDDVVRQLERRIADRLGTFDAMGLVGADYFASAVGPAFEVFAQYQKVTRLSGDEVDVDDLMVLAREAVARHAMSRLLGDDSVGGLDPVSLLYLTWRWAYLTAKVPADDAYKLERAFDVDLSTLEGPHGLAVRAGANFTLRQPDDRRGLAIGPSSTLVDVLHQACLLWDSGRRRELEGLLSETGAGTDRAFWSLGRALAQVLPEGDRERTMLLGLTNNQETLAATAAAASVPRPEQQRLL
jgi:adenine-specific DNA methylase